MNNIGAVVIDSSVFSRTKRIQTYTAYDDTSITGDGDSQPFSRFRIRGSKNRPEDKIISDVI